MLWRSKEKYMKDFHILRGGSPVLWWTDTEFINWQKIAYEALQNNFLPPRLKIHMRREQDLLLYEDNGNFNETLIRLFNKLYVFGWKIRIRIFQKFSRIGKSHRVKGSFKQRENASLYYIFIGCFLWELWLDFPAKPCMLRWQNVKK